MHGAIHTLHDSLRRAAYKQVCCSQRGMGICCLIFEDTRTFQCWEDAGVVAERNVDVGSYSSFVSCLQTVVCQHKDCVALLLERGANPDLRGAGGNTAHHSAAVIPPKSPAEQSLEHNAHIDAQNEVSLDFG